LILKNIIICIINIFNFNIVNIKNIIICTINIFIFIIFNVINIKNIIIRSIKMIIRSTKHVEIDRFFIKEKLDGKIVELPKDILTKTISNRVFSKFLDKLGMCDIYAPT
jgi:hypothetical protein